MAAHVKTSVEMSDELLARGKAEVQREESTLLALLEESLQLALKRRAGRVKLAVPALPMYGSLGLTDEFLDAGWAGIRNEIHRLPRG